MRISHGHSNRLAYNWLLYDAVDAFLSANTLQYRGELIDLGCGEQAYRDFFQQYCDRYVGVDWPSTVHRFNPDVAADLNQPLPFASASVDTVVSISVLEHLAEPARFLGEAHRILKPNGWLILQVPFQWHEHEAPHDYFRYTRFGLEFLLQRAGFSSINVQPIAGFWTMWILKLNYQLKKLARGPAPVKLAVYGLLSIVWWLDQQAARLLDHVWQGEQETAGYFVMASK